MRDRCAITTWLALCALLVACMVLIGGYTRLSGSGLSITQWKPIHGTLPPANEKEWWDEFAAYQTSPQYQKINKGMTLEEFKSIFWPEYIHRLLGRLIGAVFFLPLIAFAVRRSLSKRMVWRLGGIFALGGLQGVIGWLMVASGLVDDPHVSHLRLALHLSTAFAIYALILWVLIDIAAPARQPAAITGSARRWFGRWFVILCIQIVYGAFMAGLHGGLIYNTWPDMNGQIIPGGLTSALPFYANLTDNIIMVQFIHRKLAVLLALGYLFWWWNYRIYVKTGHLGKLCAAVAVALAAQFTLGVLTLLNQAPLPLALAHQMTALLLFTASVALLHRLSSKDERLKLYDH